MDTQIPELLRRAREGDPEASQELMPLVYAELRIMLESIFERSARTIPCSMALVNEVYIRMFGSAAPNVADKAHFLAIRIPDDEADIGGLRPHQSVREKRRRP